MKLTTGIPYWLINNGLPSNYPKLNKSIKTDVVIIGGGISGALTAYYLINAGLKCVVVDARTIGLGSTCASTSLLQYELDKPLVELSKQIGVQFATRAYKLCSDAIDTIENISAKIKFTKFEKQKSLFFAAYKKDKNLIKEEFAARKNAEFQVQLLDEKDINQLYGFSAPAAILSSKGAVTDAYMFTHALLQNSVKKELQVFDRTVVTKIIYNKTNVKLTTEKGYQLTASKVVNASGYEITEFIEKKIVTLSSTYAMASENTPLPAQLSKDPTMMWNTAQPYLYIRLTKDNRIIVGGRDEAYYNPGKRDKLKIGRAHV